MTQPQYAAITKAADFTKWVDRLIEEDKPFGFDIETGYDGPDREGTALEPKHPNWKFAGFSFTNSYEWAFYVPIAHDNEEQNVDDPTQVARDLWRLLQTGNAICYNMGFELKGTGTWFRQMLSDDPELGEAVTADFGLFPFYGDPQLLAFVGDMFYGEKLPRTGTMVRQDLKSVVEYRLKHRMTQIEELFEGMNVKKKSIRFNILDVSPKVIKYACEDSLWCLKLYFDIREDLDQDEEEGKYDDMAYQIELKLLPVVARMDNRGIPLDWEYLEQKLKEAEALRDEMNEEIMDELSERLGEVININLASPKQVAELLYDKLEISMPKVNGEASRSTAEKPLEAKAKEDKAIRDILKWRTVNKMIGSYIEKYITKLNYAGDGKAYPSHNATGAISGRFSVSGLSYQQLPKPYHYSLKNGREFHLAFREVIKAPDNYRIVGFDYSQIQLRMMAGFAQEKAMLSAFERGTDIHTATASSMLGIPEDKVTGKDRGKGKTLNFSIVFGQGPDALANSLTTPEDPVSIDDAEKLLSLYYEGFPGLKAWMDTVKTQARAKKHVRGLFGRRYFIWEKLSDMPGVRAKGDRTAVNEPIQGAEAEYMKLAMVRADGAIRKAGLQDKIQLVIMVHDALEFFVHESVTTEEVIALLDPQVSYSIEKFHPNFPKISADWHEGPNLGALVEIDLNAEGKITGYNMKQEISGEPTMSWEGTTYDEVFSQYQEWRKTEHPEARMLRGEKKPKIEVPETVVDESEPKDIHIRMKDTLKREKFQQFMTYLQDNPGKNTVTILNEKGKVTLEGTYSIDEKSQSMVNFLLGNSTMYEVKPELALTEPRGDHPF